MPAAEFLIIVVLFLVGVAVVGVGIHIDQRGARTYSEQVRRAHLRALAGAAFEVQRAADDYGRLVVASTQLEQAVRAYQNACSWMLLVLASGPTPYEVRALTATLSDPRCPEAVVATRAGDELLMQLAELQNAEADRRLGSSPNAVAGSMDLGRRVRVALRRRLRIL
jgi:hypothetical protein